MKQFNGIIMAAITTLLSSCAEDNEVLRVDLEKGEVSVKLERYPRPPNANDVRSIYITKITDNRVVKELVNKNGEDIKKALNAQLEKRILAAKAKGNEPKNISLYSFQYAYLDPDSNRLRHAFTRIYIENDKVTLSSHKDADIEIKIEVSCKLFEKEIIRYFSKQQKAE